MKSVEEATAARHKILYAFEAAERVSDARERLAWLTFVIVGAGTTGVEVPGELRYNLLHAYGAAFDNPSLLVACVVGDGEAEGGRSRRPGTRISS